MRSDILTSTSGRDNSVARSQVTEHKRPSIADVVVTVLLLVALLTLSVYFFGDASSQGANQVALTIVAAVVGLIGIKNGLSWADIEKSIVSSISTALTAMLILLAVGALIGSWILSGTVPTMVYYGGQLLDPGYFYMASCVVCALVAMCVGSSWTVAGTIGLGIMGTAASLGMSPAIAAGAVISGAYFGDKMSPLSDTTNLAPAVAGTDLFTHIRHMCWTTVPSITLSLLLFLILGWRHSATAGSGELEGIAAGLNAAFHINVFMLAPLALVLFMAVKKVPALPTILAGTAAGCLFAVIFQPQAVYSFVGDSSLSPVAALLKGAWTVLFDGYVSNVGEAQIDELLSRGGMASMLSTLWLIMSAMVFGGLMEKTGMLSTLVRGLISTTTTSASLVARTVLTCFSANIVTADQYISIVMPGRMYREEYARRGLDARTLSRVLEDSGTITSPLIPWNTCGAFLAGTLGVATLAYLPFCFFNIINPIVSILLAYMGVGFSKTVTPGPTTRHSH